MEMSGACKNDLSSAVVEEPVRLPIRGSGDVVGARQQGRDLALQIGFASSEVTVIAAAISEIARNIVDYAEQGEMTLQKIEQGNRQGILIVAEDRGPGIPDVADALQYGFASRRGIGVGLPGAKWLMDEFEIVSKPGKGTKVTMRKWLV
jgi:serine/threonine-protein kinase RsbT